MFVYTVYVSCEFIVLVSIFMYCLVFSGVYVLCVTVIISQEIHFGYKSLLYLPREQWSDLLTCYIFTWLLLCMQLLVNLFRAHFLSTLFPRQEYLHQQPLLLCETMEHFSLWQCLSSNFSEVLKPFCLATDRVRR